MKRREFLEKTAAFGVFAAIHSAALGAITARSGAVETQTASGEDKSAVVENPLKPPAKGSIPVAFVLSQGAVVIDFAGPWEVFESANDPSRDEETFHLYTVAETTKPIRASGGMKIIPDYTFATAPAPKVIVIPAQKGVTDAMLNWIRKTSKQTDITMSVCTGAFVLARTGLLSGKAATTHHNSYGSFERQFPDIEFKRGARFVEAGNLASSAGLSAGIDLALRVVERYFGREIAEATAYQLEYQGKGWMDPSSNSAYLKERVSTDTHPLCPVCGMEAGVATSPKSVYKNVTYYFCTPEHKASFDAAPENFVKG